MVQSHKLQICLHIDTSRPKVVEIKLKKDKKVIDSLTKEHEYGSQILLPLIDQLLRKNNLDYKDLTKIEVETGPGSFTGLRVGISVANALAFALSIPVNGKKLETDVKY